MVTKKIRPGYNKTEVGVIPTDWNVKKFDEVMDGFFSGQTPYRGKPIYYTGNIPWITSGELNYNIITDTLEKITLEAVHDKNLKMLPKGTFLFAITGLEAEKTRGACAITGIETTTNQSCMALFPKKGLLITQYLYHYYVKYGKWLALKYCQGTKQQSYTAGIAKILPIIVPPNVEEQSAIAQVLSDTDALIESLEKIIEKKKKIKHGTMQELLTGKKRLSEFKGKWGTMAINDIAQRKEYSIVDGPFGSQMKVNEFVEKGVPVIEMEHLENRQSIGNVTRFITEQKFEIIKRSAVYPDDIVISKTGTLGLIGIIPSYIRRGIITSRLAKISVNKSKANVSFVFHWLRKLKLDDYWREVSQGGTMQILGIKMLKEAPFPKISLNEQSTIAQILSDMDREIEILEQKRDKYRQLKIGMMQQLLTGGIRLKWN